MNVAPPDDREALPSRRHTRPDNPPTLMQHTISKDHLPPSHLPFPSPSSFNHQLAGAKVFPYASSAYHCKTTLGGSGAPKNCMLLLTKSIGRTPFFYAAPCHQQLWSFNLHKNLQDSRPMMTPNIEAPHLHSNCRGAGVSIPKWRLAAMPKLQTNVPP